MIRRRSIWKFAGRTDRGNSFVSAGQSGNQSAAAGRWKLSQNDGTHVIQAAPEAALQPVRRRMWQRFADRNSWGMRRW
jgi:hypothetical protein